MNLTIASDNELLVREGEVQALQHLLSEARAENARLRERVAELESGLGEAYSEGWLDAKPESRRWQVL